MRAAQRVDTERVRSRIVCGAANPSTFRAALRSVPERDRDAWLDRVCELGEIPEDEPELPTGCVPYLPCSVATLLDVIEHARVGALDVFVDVGSGLGRATTLARLLTGAGCIGIEIQPGLVRRARMLATRLDLSRWSVVEGDAADLTGYVVIGTVFFLYCPFSGARLDKVLHGLEAIARTRQIRVCCVDLPLPPCPWLRRVALPSPELVVYASARVHPGGSGACQRPGGGSARPSMSRSSTSNMVGRVPDIVRPPRRPDSNAGTVR